jgi:hypothetical protein
MESLFANFLDFKPNKYVLDQNALNILILADLEMERMYFF